MQTFQRIRRSIAAVLLVLYLPGCTSWRLAEVSPQQLFLDGKPKQVRVTTAAGRQLELTRPWLVADTLRGYITVRNPARTDETVTVVQDTATAIPLADITRIQVLRVDWGMIGLGGLVVLVVVGVAAGGAMADMGNSW
jgi:hypothetical protein